MRSREENKTEKRKNSIRPDSTKDNVVYVNDLYEAVRVAKEKTFAGEACVMSPAAPSYGYFKNFEERGEVFKKLVLDK